MSEHHLYCRDCERETPHSGYGDGEILATCDVCDYLRYLPITDNDNDENESPHAHEQATLVEAGNAGESEQ